MLVPGKSNLIHSVFLGKDISYGLRMYVMSKFKRYFTSDEHCSQDLPNCDVIIAATFNTCGTLQGVLRKKV